MIQGDSRRLVALCGDPQTRVFFAQLLGEKFGEFERYVRHARRRSGPFRDLLSTVFIIARARRESQMRRAFQRGPGAGSAEQERRFRQRRFVWLMSLRPKARMYHAAAVMLRAFVLAYQRHGLKAVRTPAGVMQLKGRLNRLLMLFHRLLVLAKMTDEQVSGPDARTLLDNLPGRQRR